MSYIAHAIDGYDAWKTEPDKEPATERDPEDEPDDFDERRWQEDA